HGFGRFDFADALAQVGHQGGRIGHAPMLTPIPVVGACLQAMAVYRIIGQSPAGRLLRRGVGWAKV
ncbi:MAG TPA: hypothetical protein VFJ01_12855, partial [Oleiagrimonas sp.]|nr:hypothetical protein [Oleiagrimonas sp.]